MTGIGDRGVRVGPPTHVYGYVSRPGDNEPKTASRAKRVRDRKDPGERPRQCGSGSQTVLLVQSGGTPSEGCFADPGTGRLKGDRGPWGGLARGPEGGQRARSAHPTVPTGPVTRLSRLSGPCGFLAV